MKKVLLLLSFLVAFFVSNAQYPVVQFLGRDSALVDSRGGLKARLINYAFTDTTQANTQRISQYPGAFIYTTSGGDKLWLRSSDATLWTRVGTTSGGGNGIASLGTSAYGLIIQNDSTYKVDTILLSTKLWRQKGIDSVQSNVNLKLNITDTANIRARLYAGSNVTITGTYPNLTIASSGSGGGTTGIRFDSSYTPMGGSRGADSFVVKSVRIRKNSVTVTPTQVGDSAMYWDISVPEQVNLTAGSNVSITGTYPNLTIASTGGGVSDTSVLLVDTLYNRIATVINVDSMRLKSVEIKLNGSAVTPTTTDSTLSWDILASGGTTGVKSIEIVGDSAYLVNDSSTFVNPNKVYGYADGSKGWKDTKKMTFTIPYTGEVVMISGDSLINGRKVDSIYRTAGKDSIIFEIAGTRYAVKDSTGGGGGATPAGNYGNVQLNRNSALASPASDSLSFTSGSGLNVKGTYLINSQVIARIGSGTNTSIYGNGGASATGAYNTVLGVGAGASLTSGTNNTLLGSRAGNTGTITGTHNTAVGEAALYALAGGTHNTAVGSAALQSNSTASGSTAVGTEALLSNNASNNTAIGRGAGYSNTSGTNNLLNGFQTGYHNSTGSNNTWVGYQAGTGVSTNSNSNNTGTGYKALTAVTTGSNNIALGYQAADNLTSGTKNIVIGYDIDVPTATGSNQLSIGNLIFGTGLTGSGTTAAGKVGVLNSAPDSTLDVTGGFKVSAGVRFSGIPNGGTTSDSLLVATSTGEVKKINNSFASGIHTPTATNGANVTASTPGQTQYMRVGNTVTVSGFIEITCTSANASSQIDLTIPIASAFTNTVQLSGTTLEAVTGVASPGHGTISSEATNDRLTIDFTPRATGSLSYRFTYTYQIL